MSWNVPIFVHFMKSISKFSWIALLFLLIRIGFEFYLSPSFPSTPWTTTNTLSQPTVQETNELAAAEFLSKALNKASIHRCKSPTNYQPSATNTSSSSIWTEQCNKDWGWRLFSDWMSNQKLVIDGHSRIQCAINPRTFSFCKYTNVTMDYGKARVTGLTRTFDTGFFATYGRYKFSPSNYYYTRNMTALSAMFDLFIHICSSIVHSLTTYTLGFSTAMRRSILTFLDGNTITPIQRQE